MQEEGIVSKSEDLVDLQMTEPKRAGMQKFTPKLFVNFRLDEAVLITMITPQYRYQLKL